MFGFQRSHPTYKNRGQVAFGPPQLRGKDDEAPGWGGQLKGDGSLV